jgi:hypothetical protein
MGDRTVVIRFKTKIGNNYKPKKKYSNAYLCALLKIRSMRLKENAHESFSNGFHK